MRLGCRALHILQTTEIQKTNNHIPKNTFLDTGDFKADKSLKILQKFVDPFFPYYVGYM